MEKTNSERVRKYDWANDLANPFRVVTSCSFHRVARSARNPVPKTGERLAFSTGSIGQD